MMSAEVTPSQPIPLAVCLFVCSDAAVAECLRLGLTVCVQSGFVPYAENQKLTLN